MKDVAQLLNDMIALPSQKGLAILRPIYEFCANRGWYPEGEAVRVGDWPVQFIPAFNPLTEEAMRRADTAGRFGLQPEWMAFSEKFLDE